MFQKWPRLVAEYKPAFGAVFAQYLVNYLQLTTYYLLLTTYYLLLTT